ncbi:hypothetical protein FISHEDRAFT_72231 [Fistulina hepatica ATCC 64428]|uniref:Reverse transcriptase RNase H-like domain-containing protein n=1 Tax=Fistulina hepatica ATCC 64428 TaxID=1128425 RepID=A0A0D7AEV0_9AGAR|nr:hypothetical protein FISHEDRAFT_72231 [Fistulina hepatica ATCC 64428]
MNLFEPEDGSPPGIPVRTVNIESSTTGDQLMDDGAFISASSTLQVNAVMINEESSSDNEENDGPESDFSQDKEGASDTVAHAPESRYEPRMERDLESQVGMVQLTGKQNRKKPTDEEKCLRTLTRTSTIPCAVGRIVPRGIILAVKIEGHVCHTLKDSGSHTDPISASLAKHLIEGQDFRTGDIIALYSAKLPTTRQNYPVNKIKMLAHIDTVLRHRDVLQGFHSAWITDHKESKAEFSFEIKHLPGEQKVLADTLMRSPAEYTSFDEDGHVDYEEMQITRPLITGVDALLMLLPLKEGTALVAVVQADGVVSQVVNLPR